jgi:hypothetical protein
MKIYAGKYWEGDWPYDSSCGIGLRLSGIPIDDAKFVQILQDESCNPIATRVHLQSLKANGFLLTTVVTSLRVWLVGEKLEAIGVNLEVVPPLKPEPDHSEKWYAALQIALGKEPSNPQYAEIGRELALRVGPLVEADIGRYGGIGR